MSSDTTLKEAVMRVIADEAENWRAHFQNEYDTAERVFAIKLRAVGSRTDYVKWLILAPLTVLEVVKEIINKMSSPSDQISTDDVRDSEVLRAAKQDEDWAAR